jgi:ketosteroid isomerase-like protein
MVKVVIEEDCENAPKKQYVRDFNVAFAKSDMSRLLSMVSDDVSWTMVGTKTIEGKAAVERELQTMLKTKPTALILDSIISHGDRCAASGTLKYGARGSVAFCDMYVFTSHGKNARIKDLMSYAIETK